MMTVHPDQDDQKCYHSRMNFRTYVQLPLYVYGVDASIDNQTLKPPHILIVHLADLDNGRNPDIGALNKERRDIFPEFCTKIFKAKFLCYANELIFEMVKTALKDKYLGGKPPTAL